MTARREAQYHHVGGSPTAACAAAESRMSLSPAEVRFLEKARPRMRPSAFIEQAGKPFWVIVGLGILGLVGLADHLLTPYGMSVALFYVLPIGLVTWFVDAKTGVGLGILTAGMWLLNDLLPGSSSPTGVALVWNTTLRLLFLSLAVLALRLGKAYEYQRAVANTDFLTGAYNRRFFSALAQREVDRLERYDSPLTVAYFDLDNFKALNDTLGHSAGNRCLQSVVRVIKANLRKADIVARMGGDEFAMLFPDTNQDAARVVLSKVCTLIQDEMTKNEWPITLSMGVRTFLRPAASVDEMLRLVDMDMYSVKKIGKNGVSYFVFPDQQPFAVNRIRAATDHSRQRPTDATIDPEDSDEN